MSKEFVETSQLSTSCSQGGGLLTLLWKHSARLGNDLSYLGLQVYVNKRKCARKTNAEDCDFNSVWR